MAVVMSLLCVRDIVAAQAGAYAGQAATNAAKVHHSTTVFPNRTSALSSQPQAQPDSLPGGADRLAVTTLHAVVNQGGSRRRGLQEHHVGVGVLQGGMAAGACTSRG